MPGTRPVPVFSKTPQKIWKGTTAPGADNGQVFGDLLGYSEEHLAALKAAGTI